MTRTKNTIAATFAALLVGGLMINPASTAVTHAAGSAEAKQVGRYSGKNYSRSDITSVTHN